MLKDSDFAYSKNRQQVTDILGCEPLNQLQTSNSHIAAGEDLCLACGLCCDGTIFSDVQLLAGDDAERLEKLGLVVKCSGSHPKFVQPCVAHDGCRCRIYDERPSYCREFDCALLKSWQDGSIAKEAALQIIRMAREQVALVKELLGRLGDKEVTLPLGVRFRRTAKRLERRNPDKANSDLFSKLTLAVHDLNSLIQKEFYPGDRRSSDEM